MLFLKNVFDCWPNNKKTSFTEKRKKEQARWMRKKGKG
jgi:hypothetical protein